MESKTQKYHTEGRAPASASDSVNLVCRSRSPHWLDDTSGRMLGKPAECDSADATPPQLIFEQPARSTPRDKNCLPQFPTSAASNASGGRSTSRCVISRSPDHSLLILVQTGYRVKGIQGQYHLEVAPAASPARAGACQGRDRV